MRYIFILGSQADLAKQELSNIFNSRLGRVIKHGQKFSLIDSDLSPDKLMTMVGSTVKIAELIDSLNSLDKLTTDKIIQYLKVDTDDKKRINFGFSLYDGSNKIFAGIQKTCLAVKKSLKEQGHSVRLVSSRSSELSSVIVKKNNLLGRELIIIKDGNDWHIGLSQAVQDFASYQYRDMNRPERDDRSGMLPPKLAQTMINLSGPDRNKILLDPFCGSGTILQEAALLGYEKIIGTDNDKKVIEHAEKNIAWLRNNYSFKTAIDFKLTDVRRLSEAVPQNLVDIIVSEPFMGDARQVKRAHTAKEIAPIKAELQELYVLAFKNFKEILKSSGKIIFVFPIFSVGERKFPVLEVEKISRLGFKLIKPEFGSSLSENHNLVYARDDQKVWREITVWQKI